MRAPKHRSIVFGSQDGRIYVLDELTGKLIWSNDLGADIIAPPMVLDGRIAVGSTDGVFYVFG